MTSQSIPKYRKQKERNGNDRAIVVLDGVRVHLGSYDSDESREVYRRVVAEWLAGGRHTVGQAGEFTITELVAEFWIHAQKHYRLPSGQDSHELENYRYILKHVTELYGSTACEKFGPRSLKTIRTRFINLGWCRSNINKCVTRIKHVFKWGVENEIVNASTYHALQCVGGLSRGRTDARENPPRLPVPSDDIESVRKLVSRQVRSLIDLQLYSGARPGELVSLRAVDMDTSKPVWVYRPTSHKTAHYGHDRAIYFGPRSQEILHEFIADRPVDAYLFDPREAVAERHAQAETHRRANQKPNHLKSDRKIGDCYTTESYRRAIQRACVAAKIPSWSPHRLRHNAATNLRAEVGIDVTQTMLGHRLGSKITELYAEKNVEQAIEAARKVG